MLFAGRAYVIRLSSSIAISADDSSSQASCGGVGPVKPACDSLVAALVRCFASWMTTEASRREVEAKLKSSAPVLVPGAVRPRA